MLIGVLAVVVSVFGVTQSASAHFEVEDDTTGLKAVFHITPDHDPIAGEESVISFDFSKTNYEAQNYDFSLRVKSTKYEAVTVPVEVAGNVVVATYAFPSQGFYSITLTATEKNNETVSKLQYGQRVSRGVVIEHDKGLGPLEIGVMAAAAVLSIGAIIFSVISDSDKRKVKKK